MQRSVPAKSLERKQQLQSLWVLQVVMASWIHLQEVALKNEIPQNADELEPVLIPLTVDHPIAPIQVHPF